jgi:hypothetical protein
MKARMRSNFESSPHGATRSYAKILVLGDPSVGSYICRGLEKRGYKCSLANLSDAAGLIRSNHFALVISLLPIDEGDPLLFELGGSQCTVFSYQPCGGDNCWLPIMNRGTECFGTPALRPSDFINLVHKLMTEVDGATAMREQKLVH